MKHADLHGAGKSNSWHPFASSIRSLGGEPSGSTQSVMPQGMNGRREVSSLRAQACGTRSICSQEARARMCRAFAEVLKLSPACFRFLIGVADRNLDARLLLVVGERDRSLPYLAVVLVRDTIEGIHG